MVIKKIKRALSDALFIWDARQALRRSSPDPGLRVYVFHSLFPNREAVQSGSAFPHEGVTVAQFESFLATCQARGDRFVSPDDIAADKLDPGASQILITFDDGYANNLEALPLLEAYEAPAAFCLCTEPIATQRRYWWDVVYSEACRGGAPPAEAIHQVELQKQVSPQNIYDQLTDTLGANIFDAQSPYDRPMTPIEVAQLAAHPRAHIVNHSHRHPLFTNLTPAEIAEEWQTSQKLIKAWTGKAPVHFAYPNGSCNADTHQLLHDLGAKLLFTTKRAFYPQQTPQALGRITLYGSRPVDKQIAIHQFRGSGWWKRS